MVRRAGENGLLFVENYLARGEHPSSDDLPTGA
jgi:hypothetical protein